MLLLVLPDGVLEVLGASSSVGAGVPGGEGRWLGVGHFINEIYFRSQDYNILVNPSGVRYTHLL